MRTRLASAIALAALIVLPSGRARAQTTKSGVGAQPGAAPAKAPGRKPTKKPPRKARKPPPPAPGKTDVDEEPHRALEA
jgi:hypothetical protein